MRLLAVDDDPVILDLLPIIFRQADLTDMVTADSSASALQILQNQSRPFECILLDIEMPGMTGIELCTKIRQMPQYRHTPILMLTSVTDNTRIERAFAAGADDYITKPFDVKEIATRVRVAQRMTEKSGNAPILDTTKIDQTLDKGTHDFALSDPVRLHHAAQMILPFALGNYLSQLSRTRLDSCTIFAAHIADVDSLFANSKPHEFAIALSETVDSIAEVVNCPNLLMAYEGDGTFLCILQGAEAPAWPDIEDQILEVLEERAPVFDDGRPMNLDVSVGNPVMPNASRNQRVKKTFDRARARAFSRAMSKEKLRARIARSQAPMRGLPRSLS
jgi:DNA-binding response OmpR family regulator